MTWMKKWTANLCLLFFSLIVSLFMAELMLRFFEYKPAPDFALTYRNYFRPDNEAGFDIQENFPKTRARLEDSYTYEFWSNEIGCFDTPFSGHGSYILLLGESFTHMFAPFQDKWGTILQESLDFRVLKCGVTGYGTKQEYLKAQKIISRVKTPTKLIIIGYYINDFTEDYLFPMTTVVKGFTASLQKIADLKSGTIIKKNIQTVEREVDAYQNTQRKKSSLVSNSLLYKKAKGFIRLLTASLKQKPLSSQKSSPMDWRHLFGFLVLPESEYPWIKTGWDMHFENFRAFKRLAEEQGAHLLVVMIPSQHEVYFPELLRENGIDLAAPGKKLREFFEKEKISCLDLLPLFSHYAKQERNKVLDPGKDLYWRKDGHWSIKGNHLAGLLVARYILEHNLVAIKNKDAKLEEVEEKLKSFK